MNQHKDSGMRCLLLHAPEDGQCLKCSQCNQWIAPKDWETDSCSEKPTSDETVDGILNANSWNSKPVVINPSDVFQIGRSYIPSVASFESYTILPGQPNEIVSTPLRVNVPGTSSLIHEFTVPAGCVVKLDEMKILFHPHDVESNSIGGACKIYRTSPSNPSIERIWAWSHNTHPWIRRIIRSQTLLKAGDSLRMEVTLDKKLDPTKTDYEMIVSAGKYVV